MGRVLGGGQSGAGRGSQTAPTAAREVAIGRLICPVAVARELARRAETVRQHREMWAAAEAAVAFEPDDDILAVLNRNRRPHDLGERAEPLGSVASAQQQSGR